MFTRIQSRHFRCLKWVDQRLDRFQALVGPNASGKTTFLDVITLLSDLMRYRGDVPEAVHQRSADFTKLVWKGEGSSFQIAVETMIPEPVHAKMGKDKQKFRAVRYEVEIELDAESNEISGRGHSVASLRNFREFYLAYPDRLGEIHYSLGSEWPAPGEPMEIQYPAGSESHCGFHPNLSWSHYRALMRVEKPEARGFYEQEAALAGWSKRELERQIGSLYYERLLMSRDKRGMLRENRNSTGTAHPLDKDTEKIFASRYRMALPSEAELAAEVRREMLALGAGESPPAALPPVRPEKQKALRSKGPRKKKP